MPLINFSGLASGIDSESLIEATVEARRSTRVEPKEKEVTELEGANTALQELTTLLQIIILEVVVLVEELITSVGKYLREIFLRELLL